MFFHLSRQSKNAKTGPIPTVVISDDSCPPSCKYKDNGCYAQIGPMAIHWAKVNDGNRGVDFATFLEELGTLPRGTIWRYAVAGDLPGKGDRIHAGNLKRLILANTGRLGFTYTHKPVHKWNNADLIALANKSGFTVNLSSNNLAHADELLDACVGPVVTILPSDYGEIVEYVDPKTGKPKQGPRWKKCLTDKGNLVVQCPAEYSPVQCSSCGNGRPLCQRADRNYVVGFTAHGTRKNKADRVAKGLPILAA